VKQIRTLSAQHQLTSLAIQRVHQDDRDKQMPDLHLQLLYGVEDASVGPPAKLTHLQALVPAACEVPLPLLLQQPHLTALELQVKSVQELPELASPSSLTNLHLQVSAFTPTLFRRLLPLIPLVKSLRVPFFAGSHEADAWSGVQKLQQLRSIHLSARLWLRSNLLSLLARLPMLHTVIVSLIESAQAHQCVPMRLSDLRAIGESRSWKRVRLYSSHADKATFVEQMSDAVATLHAAPQDVLRLRALAERPFVVECGKEDASTSHPILAAFRLVRAESSGSNSFSWRRI
jgi:hypothetical protein